MELPVFVQAQGAQNLEEFLQANVAEMQDLLDRGGAILLRGFRVTSPERLKAIATAIGDIPRPYLDRRSPRKDLGQDVYTSTIYPSDQSIHLHNEMSFAHEWPERLYFCCIRPAETGGMTPLANSRRVLERLSPATRERFEQAGVLYLRNFREGMGMSWQETFQTEDRLQVEAFCTSAGIKTEWSEDNRHLRTWQKRPGTIAHPRTGEKVFFNQAHHFHPRTLPEKAQRLFRASFTDIEAPRNAFFGDGASISDEIIDEIMAAYDHETVEFDWQEGDLVIVDNVLVAHGRSPYTGDRLIGLLLCGRGSVDLDKG